MPAAVLAPLALDRPSPWVAAAVFAAAGLLVLHRRLTGTMASGQLGALLGLATVTGLFLVCVRHVTEGLGAALPVGLGVAGTVVLAFAALRATALPAAARLGLAVALVALGAGSLLAGPPVFAGAGLLLVTSAALLNDAAGRQRRSLVDTRFRLETAELGLRESRAKLHEIDATVAGIASAQRLISCGLPADRSDALAAMMRAEVERLQRLVADRAPSRVRSVDLDDVLGQIVTAHRARGRSVRWQPAGVRALGRSDDVAEVVNVLLENAAVHGRADEVEVDVSPDLDGNGVAVTVSDRGRGIPAELRERVFDWGVSRPGSPGQGIGLHVAAELSHELGGRLELLPTAVGTAFRLHLPAPPREVSVGESVARAS